MSSPRGPHIRRVKGGEIFKDALYAGDQMVAFISCGRVRPAHGYLPPHPMGFKVRNWAKKNGVKAPMYTLQKRSR